MLKDLTDLKDYFAFLDYSISELQSWAMFHSLNIQYAYDNGYSLHVTDWKGIH